MLHGALIYIRLHHPCASLPIYLSIAVRKCPNGIPFPFPVTISARRAPMQYRNWHLHWPMVKHICKLPLKKGLDINVFAQRLSFFFNAHNNIFEEVAKFRAARRMWAHITKALGATDPKAQMLRFHTQTGGSTLTAQQPKNNIVRVAMQALSAVLGGTQSLHTNGYDEALILAYRRSSNHSLAHPTDNSL